MTCRGEDVFSLCHAAPHVALMYFQHNFQQVNYNLASFVEDVHVNRGARMTLPVKAAKSRHNVTFFTEEQSI